MMKAKGIETFGARRLGAVVAVAFALVASSMTTGFAADPVFGAACPTEDVNTGTSTTSLICAKNSIGKLTWSRVRIAAQGTPVAAMKAAPGTIEFHHWRHKVSRQRLSLSR